MDLLTISYRTTIVYFVVLIAIRVMGKREVGKLTVFDLVISIMFAEVAIMIVDDPDRPFVEGVLPIAILVLIQIMMSILSLKSRRFRLLLDGRPSVLIRHGKIDREVLRKQKYNLDDLFNQLREKNITNISDVEFAVLETTGKLSVIEKDKFRSEQGTDGATDPSKEKTIPYNGLPLPLVMDGKVQDHHLVKIGKTRNWLKKKLRQKGIVHFEDVFLCTYDHRGHLYIDKK